MRARRPRLPSPAAASISGLAVLLALGCTNRTKEEILPQTGPTLQQVYDRHFESRREDPRAALGPRGAADDPGLEGYTREAATEIDARFPRLPNPDLVLYVFPHLSDAGHPVPGYSTVFPFYDTVEYALPGEREGW
jgi:conjugative transfer region lipoprotein (TIGR03751 family)